jgi:hypothetical protein
MSVKPLSPEEARETLAIPDFVIESINELIQENYDGRASFTILRKQIIERIASKTQAEFDNRWLNFEQAFRSVGWEVTRDSPGYDECYETNWRFSPIQRQR